MIDLPKIFCASIFMTLSILLPSSDCINCNITAIPQTNYNGNYLNPKFYFNSNQFCNKSLTQTITFNFSSPDCGITKAQQFNCTGSSSWSIQLCCDNNITGTDQTQTILINGTAIFNRGNVACSCQGTTSVEFKEFVPTPQPAPPSWPIVLGVVVVVTFALVIMKICSKRAEQENNNDLLLLEE